MFSNYIAVQLYFFPCTELSSHGSSTFKIDNSHVVSLIEDRGLRKFGVESHMNCLHLLPLLYSLFSGFALSQDRWQLILRLLYFRGYNIGTRLVDEFLAKSNVSNCVDFKETADTIAKVFC
jgi:hypothetical protein